MQFPRVGGRRFSLRGRMLLVATLVLFVFLSLMGAVLDQAFRRSVEQGVSERLLLHVYGLLALTEVNSGEVYLPEALPEPGFNQLGSGLFAIILDGSGRELWRSASALDLSLATRGRPNLVEGVVTGDPLFGEVRDEVGERLFFLSYRVQWQAENGDVTPYVFCILQTRDTYEGEVNGFRNNLWGWLVGVVLVLSLVQALVMNWGLAPLRELERDLKQIEDGTEESLAGDYPAEIAGVTRNLNLLIANEREQREKYRTTLADLAHSLKTPLAILQGGTASLASTGSADDHTLDEIRKTVDEQVVRMNEIVAYQLERAVASSTNLIRRPVPVGPVVENLVTALGKVYREREVAFRTEIADVSFYGDERDLMELLGNLVDNACKYGGGDVGISIAPGSPGGIEIEIEDNGPGIAVADRESVLDRGTRLDSRESGQGIGLAVVGEIVRRYGGSISVDKATLGGARIVVTLP